MQKILVILGLGLILISFPTPAVGSGYIPAYVNKEPVLLPDSPLYFVKTIYETFRYVLAFTPKRKVDLGMFLAERRLREAEKAAEVGNKEQAAKLLTDYQKKLESIQQIIQTAGEVGSTASGFSSQTQESWRRQKDILDTMGVNFDAVTDLESNLDSKVTTISATIRRPYKVPVSKTATQSSQTTSPSFFGKILNWLLGNNKLISPTASDK